MLEKILYAILAVVLIAISIPVLVVVLTSVGIAIVFGEAAIWVARLICIIVILKLLWEFVMR